MWSFTKVKLNTGKREGGRIVSESHGKQHDGLTEWRVNAISNQVLGARIPRDNGQDEIVGSGNYCYASISEVSIDENKNTTIERLPWLTLKALKYCWDCCPGPSVRKISFRNQATTKMTKMQQHNTNSDIQRYNFK